MFSSRQNIRPHPLAPDGIRRHAETKSTGPGGEQTEAVSVINRQHIAAIARLLSVMDLARKIVPDAGLKPCLRDTCKAKAEILLSPEETDVLRRYLIAPKDAPRLLD